MGEFWGRLFHLNGVLPQVVARLRSPESGPELADQPVRAAPDRPARNYIVALLAATLAVFVRAALDPFLQSDHVFVMSLLAVVYVSWQCGFWPGIVTLLTSMAAMVYFFVGLRHSFVVTVLSDQLAVGLFFFCGVACAALGHAQRDARRRAAAALAESLARRAELEAEVARRTRAEADLQASEELRQNVLDNSPDSIKILDLDGQMLEMNGPGLRAREIAEGDRVRGREWAGFWPDPTGARAAVAAARAGAVGRFRAACPTTKGEIQYWDVLVAPIRRPDGLPGRLVGVSRDITETLRAEEELRASEARFRLLTETVPQIVWNGDPAGRLTYFNRRWVEFTGMTTQEGLGDGWVQAVNPDDVAHLRAAWADAIAHGSEWFDCEFRLLSQADGEYRWVRSRAVPLRDTHGVVAQWVGTFSDIDAQKRQAETLDRLVRERTAELIQANIALREQVDERRQAEEQVLAVARELQRSNGELEQFAYVASHDLQEPLRKIQAFGDLLSTKYSAPLPDLGREYVAKMQGSAGRMSRLLEDLLTFSRVTTHARPFVPVDLAATIAEVLDDLEVRIAKTGGVIEVSPLPVIDADASQIRQVFQNLIGNALKFHKPDVPPAVRIWGELGTEPLSADQTIEVCRVTVEDNGIGFDEKEIERIFQVFERLHGRDEYEGTGVGLAICRKIVDRHGGTITARSRPGVGTAFVVTLPVRQGPTGTDHAPR
jgi:PAS domain S-box-containing protein